MRPRTVRQTDTQTRVTTIHFSWSTTHAKCKQPRLAGTTPTVSFCHGRDADAGTGAASRTLGRRRRISDARTARTLGAAHRTPNPVRTCK